jgi:hypothetical protein
MLLLHIQIRRYFNNICDNNNICYTLCEYRTTDYWVDCLSMLPVSLDFPLPYSLTVIYYEYIEPPNRRQSNIKHQCFDFEPPTNN